MVICNVFFLTNASQTCHERRPSASYWPELTHYQLFTDKQFNGSFVKWGTRSGETRPVQVSLTWPTSRNQLFTDKRFNGSFVIMGTKITSCVRVYRVTITLGKLLLVTDKHDINHRPHYRTFSSCRWLDGHLTTRKIRAGDSIGYSQTRHCCNMRLVL